MVLVLYMVLQYTQGVVDLLRLLVAEVHHALDKTLRRTRVTQIGKIASEDKAAMQQKEALLAVAIRATNKRSFAIYLRNIWIIQI